MNSIRRLVEDDDDDDEVVKVSWSGEPVGSKTLTIVNHLCRILSCDWLLGVNHCPVCPQVSSGLSVRQQRPIRGQTESPPSPKSAQKQQRSARVTQGTL